MTTSLNSTIPARDRGEQLVQFIRRRLNIGQSGGLITTVAKAIGTLPANAVMVAPSGAYVTVDLGGTTNTLEVGYAADTLSTADADAYASAIALPITTGGFIAFDEIGATGATGRPRSVDTAITATFTGTATTGQIDLIIAYVPLNPAA